ncbi:hypothetical protein [Paludibacterium yongneupense]|uniref:hypothetical protein n=1 Tax=Paludibacterium yongneupense TaxID=400061 RepID=UPI001C041962|nr:hypothetical protein [Paludibacterium yongneupense]
MPQDIATGAAAPLCRRCAHYYITHDARFAYACRAMNFKSRRAPIFDVVDASGQSCQFFRPKRAAGTA